jgi:hypothetical protein
MSTLLDPRPFRCASCEASIQGRPTFFVGLAFCCAGCVAGGPCMCSYDEEPSPARVATGPLLTGPSEPAAGLAGAAANDESAPVPIGSGMEHDLLSVG